ncbi:hypothetical protein NDR87_02790 [Nocardia sp. CDC159]|uniref:Right handed beta helix domain-containing protein n=1 Tax=Nocardia pulmonis TaxID=2951408 RepID=A0A9X2IVR4_9NOCA|nr:MULTISPECIES: hypothetical protein [Nocardia]MCM6772060.1 hypothetical protein [Nocardia pulmonis]MCM6785282.1 hypothetical protein [Nocardia sp. CDC159]
MHHRLPLLRLSAAMVLITAVGAGYAAAQPDTSTWYVRAGAPAPGNGAADTPFASLAQVEAASRDGDTIVVLPAAGALDGGIALKPRQRLLGDGPAVPSAPPDAALPRITNTTTAHNGDAVVLAPGSEVRNLAIAGARRGGIYGRDAVNAVIAGNDVAGTNSGCADGFMIGPFMIPPGIGIGVAMPPLPDLIALNNGWAAVMTDFATTTGTITIANNSVRDTACGDGIDIRGSGTSDITARVSGNALRNINLGVGKLSVLAMGIQATDTARLRAVLDGNSQLDIASPDISPINEIADSEGIFVNALGRADLTVDIANNTFRGGGGNFSANGLEYVTTSGTPTSRVTVTDSSFDTVVGDLIENYNLSTQGARQSLTLTNVRARHSHFPGAALNAVIPANLGTCLVSTNFGRTGRTDLTVTGSTFGDCSADGIGLLAFTPLGPEPATAELTFDISDTTVDGTAAHALNIVNVGDTATLRGSLARTTLANARQSIVHVANRGGTIGTAAIDLGGGPLGSPGLNCVSTVGVPIEVIGLPVAAQRNWWGRPEGPNVAGLDATNALSTSPRPGCGA